MAATDATMERLRLAAALLVLGVVVVCVMRVDGLRLTCSDLAESEYFEVRLALCVAIYRLVGKHDGRARLEDTPNVCDEVCGYPGASRHFSKVRIFRFRRTVDADPFATTFRVGRRQCAIDMHSLERC